MRISWSQFKSFQTARDTDILMVEDNNFYYLFTTEHGFNVECEIDKNVSDTADLLDFENNYKSLCNKPKAEIQKTAATTPINEHCMQPFGCEKGYFKSLNAPEGDYVCAITLSNKSANGLTFNYTSNLVPEVGNYIFQNENSRRSWITDVDLTNETITVERNTLDDGVGIYSKGYYTDSLVRDWADLMYLWGITLNVQEYEGGVLESDPCADLIELSIVDKDDLFLTDAYCQKYFGVNATQAEPFLIERGFELNGEYGHWTKYYDESWIISCNGMYTPSPDGSPGEIPAGQYLRLAFFTTENEEHEYHIFADYYPTSKT